MKIRTAWFLLGVITALLFVLALPAKAQSWEVRQLLQDRAWHGVGGNTQVHQPTVEHDAPWVGVWERSPIGNQYGEWLYVKVLMNCEQWTLIPFGTLDQDDNFGLIEDVLGERPQIMWPEPGTEPYRTMTAVCGLFGYQRGRPIPPMQPAPSLEGRNIPIR